MTGRSLPVSELPPDFLVRADESDDAEFYAQPRLVTHIDDRAIAAVGQVYRELGVHGRVLDLMSSWISHLEDRPDHLTVLGMNAAELAHNEMADEAVVHDLNREPTLPFEAGSFDAAICTVSVDYLTQPTAVFAEASRVLIPGGVFVCTFSNRCFPTKAIQGWLAANDEQRCAIVARYFRTAPGWTMPRMAEVLGPGTGGDPLYAVWATTPPTPTGS